MFKTEPQTEMPEIAASAGITLFDKDDGTLEVQVTHSGEFEPSYLSHAALRAISQFLPDIMRPEGIEMTGTTGKKMPITDAERYRVIRALAFLPDAERDTLLAGLQAPNTPDDYDAFADHLVRIARISAQPKAAAAITESAPKILGANGGVLN
jgi:hypothetical protein